MAGPQTVIRVKSAGAARSSSPDYDVRRPKSASPLFDPDDTRPGSPLAQETGGESGGSGSGGGGSPLTLKRRLSNSLAGLFRSKAPKAPSSPAKDDGELLYHDCSSTGSPSPSPGSLRRRTPSRGSLRSRLSNNSVNVLRSVCPHGHEMRTVGWVTGQPIAACTCRSGTPDSRVSLSSMDTDLEPVAPSCSTSISDGTEMGPLHLAAVAGDRVAVKELVAVGGMVVDLPDADGVTPFMLAVLSGNFKCAEMLLKLGAAIDATDKNGRAALHWVVYNGLHKALVWLLKRGADWRVTDHTGRSPLHWATDHENARCLTTLLRKTPLSYVNDKDAQGMTPLCWAAHHGHAEQVRQLLNRGADPGICTTGGNTACHYASCQLDAECVELILRADPSTALSCNDEGRTPLHNACTYGSLDVARLLMGIYEQAAALDQAALDCPLLVYDVQDRTPLHCAAVAGRVEIAQELLHRGHDPEPVDFENHMPIWYARVRKHTATVEVLAKFIVRQHTLRQPPAPSPASDTPPAGAAAGAAAAAGPSAGPGAIAGPGVSGGSLLSTAIVE